MTHFYQRMPHNHLSPINVIHKEKALHFWIEEISIQNHLLGLNITCQTLFMHYGSENILKASVIQFNVSMNTNSSWYVNVPLEKKLWNFTTFSWILPTHSKICEIWKISFVECADWNRVVRSPHHVIFFAYLYDSDRLHLCFVKVPKCLWNHSDRCAWIDREFQSARSGNDSFNASPIYCQREKRTFYHSFFKTIITWINCKKGCKEVLKRNYRLSKTLTP